MIVDERTVVLVADGRHARLFEEHRRGGPLHERSDVVEAARFELSPSKLRPTVHSRHGAAAHSVETPSPKAKGEHRFFAELADLLESHARAHPFDSLVLIAPPKALGGLRKALPEGLRRRLAGEDAHDRLHDDAQAIGRALADIRSHRA